MKQCILFFLLKVLIFLPIHSKSQNAFYDARRIVAYLQMDSAKDVMPILMNYKKANAVFPWDRFSSKYPDHVGTFKKKYDLVYNKKIARLLEDTDSFKLVISNIQGSDFLISNLQKSVQDIQKAKSDFVRLDKLQQQVESKLANHELYTDLDFSALVMNANAIIEMDTTQLNVVKNYGESDSVGKQEAVENIYSILIEQRQNQLVYISSIKEIIKQQLYDERIRKYFFNEPEVRSQTNDAKAFFEMLTKEKLNSEKSFQEASVKQTTVFKTPSQAEMIDALAIYLAKRVKQEVTISFIEKLSTYIRDQPLMATLFPATLSLLNNREAFMRPYFGTSWQIAMSEDFIRIPENLPACLPYRYKHLDKYLIDGVRIGKLVEQHYSLLEAVNQLNEEPLKVDALQHANTMIYILNHEFYSQNQGKNYWIGADQLQSMNQEQLEWLYILLDLRYGDKLNKMMSPNWLGKTVWNETYFKGKIMPMRNYLTRVLIQLNYFEKELANQSQSDNKTNSLSGYWKFQNDLMNVVIDTQFLNISSKALKPLELTRGIFSIYSGLESRNYPVVVNQLLQLLSLLDIDKRSTLQDVLFTNSFSNGLQQKDAFTRSAILNHVNRLNNNYDVLVSSTTLSDMREDYAVLARRIADKGRRDILNQAATPDEAMQRILKQVKNGSSMTLDTLLFTQSFLNELRHDNRHKDIESQIQIMNYKYTQLKALYTRSMQAMQGFDSLKYLLKQNNLDKAKYYKIKPVYLSQFLGSRIFSIEASQNHAFFYRMESRQHYQKIRASLSFLSDVMQTNNSQDLSKVIEAYSLPPSSYKIKRFSRFSVNVDALVGGFVGIETIKDAQQVYQSSWAGGLSAPIGLSLSWGQRSILKSKRSRQLADNELGFVNRHGNFKLMKGYNTSLLLTVIDIGAPVSYRITKTSEGGLPSDAKWSQLFSPGLMAIVGIKGLPLCLGTGLRFTPNLRMLQQDLQRNAFRFDVGLYFDLPLINLYYK